MKFIRCTLYNRDNLSCAGRSQCISLGFSPTESGARFALYDHHLPDRFDAMNAHHIEIQADIERGCGLVDIDSRHTVDDAPRTAGFDVLETRDLSEQTGPSIPWYQPLVGSGLSLASFRSSRIGRWMTHGSLRALETLRITPPGTVHVLQNLNLCAVAIDEAGRLDIFTPMYYIHAREPT